MKVLCPDNLIKLHCTQLRWIEALDNPMYVLFVELKKILQFEKPGNRAFIKLKYIVVM